MAAAIWQNCSLIRHIRKNFHFPWDTVCALQSQGSSETRSWTPSVSL